MLFEKVGMAYVPTSLTGCVLCVLYCGMGVLMIAVPKLIFSDSRIVDAYRVVTFILFWWLGLRFAKRHSA